MPGFLESLIGRVSDMEMRTRILAAGALLGVAVLVFVVFTALGGGGDGDGDADDPLTSQMIFDDPPSAEGGGGAAAVMVDESVVEARVAATVEALEQAVTVVPTQTPDIAATFQAEMADRRERADRVLKLHPLDKDVSRNPYLNGVELRYLSDMGLVLWSNTKAWMHVRRVLFVEVADWSVPLLEYHVSEAKAALEEGKEGRSRRDYELGEVVEAYGRTINEGMTGIADAVTRLAEAQVILLGSDSGLSSDLSYEDREKLGQLKRQVERDVGEFDDAMSRYGCSVCGELFRLRGR